MARSNKTPAPVTLPAPQFRTVGENDFEVDFGKGRTARVFQAEGREMDNDWTYETDEDTQRTTWGKDEALAQAWMRCIDVPAPVTLSREKVAELAQRAEKGDTCEAAKVMREMLRLRTGYAWSVTVGKGTAYCWLTIDSAPRRRVDGHMSLADRALLGSILGQCPHYQGESVRPGSGVRAHYVWKLSGYEAAA